MPKSSKTFILSNGRVNSHGFRIVTAGIDISDFEKNPIMYWMHSDSDKKTDITSPDQLLPMGYWTDIQKNGDDLTAVPVFDDSDPFAMKIYNKVEHGTIRAASVSISPGKLDDNKANWLPGQTLPTFLTSKMDEASIVDRGSNSDAVTLSGSGNFYLKVSKKLSDRQVNPESEITGIKNVEAPKHSADTLAIMDNAVAAGKVTRLEADGMLSKVNTTPKAVETLKAVIRTMPIKLEQIQGNVQPYFKKMAASKTFDQIEATDCRCVNLAEGAPELFKAKYFEKNGRLPTGMPKRSPGNW